MKVLIRRENRQHKQPPSDMKALERQSTELCAFIKEYALFKLDDEYKRYESLITQSSNMQTAFSFTTAAAFMVAPIAIEYGGKMTLKFLLIAFSAITFLLLVSLFFASMAQNRIKIKTFLDVKEFTEYVNTNYKSYLSKAQRDKAFQATIGEIQESICKRNNRMANYIRLSMWFFYGALAVAVIFFSISLHIMFA